MRRLQPEGCPENFIPSEAEWPASSVRSCLVMTRPLQAACRARQGLHVGLRTSLFPGFQIRALSLGSSSTRVRRLEDRGDTVENRLGSISPVRICACIQSVTRITSTLLEAMTQGREMANTGQFKAVSSDKLAYACIEAAYWEPSAAASPPIAWIFGLQNSGGDHCTVSSGATGGDGCHR